jgi:hypothetical protein
MLTVLALFAAYGGVRIALAAVRALRGVPRTNDDMIFY